MSSDSFKLYPSSLKLSRCEWEHEKRVEASLNSLFIWGSSLICSELQSEVFSSSECRSTLFGNPGVPSLLFYELLRYNMVIIILGEANLFRLSFCQRYFYFFAYCFLVTQISKNIVANKINLTLQRYSSQSYRRIQNKMPKQSANLTYFHKLSKQIIISTINSPFHICYCVQALRYIFIIFVQRRLILYP